MRKLFRFFKNIYLLDRRRAQEELRQRDEGYSIELVQEGPEQYIDYIEGDRKASITVEFSWMNDVVVFTDSFRSCGYRRGRESLLCPVLSMQRARSHPPEQK